MNEQQLNLLLAYIDAKIDYEIQSRSEESDGYLTSARDERRKMEAIEEGLRKTVNK